MAFYCELKQRLKEDAMGKRGGEKCGLFPGTVTLEQKHLPDPINMFKKIWIVDIFVN